MRVKPLCLDEENKRVTPIPSVALVPNLILKGQVRAMTLSGDGLTLRAGTFTANGISVTSRLEWRRARTGRDKTEWQETAVRHITRDKAASVR